MPRRWESFSDRVACAWDNTKCRMREAVGLSAVSGRRERLKWGGRWSESSSVAAAGDGWLQRSNQ